LKFIEQHKGHPGCRWIEVEDSIGVNDQRALAVFVNAQMDA
jgi:hypothetical protein